MKKIAIYGGTFDPIHHAHLILAREAADVFAFDLVVFVPAAQSPHKMSERAAPAEDRLAMLRAAVDGEARFAVDDCELRRGAPSFAIDTVIEMRRRHPAAEIDFLIGADNVARLTSWRRWEELRQFVQFVVLERTGVASDQPYPTLRCHIDISASDIRNRVASGRSIRYLVPPAVAEIIGDRKLYQKGNQSAPTN